MMASITLKSNSGINPKLQEFEVLIRKEIKSKKNKLKKNQNSTEYLIKYNTALIMQFFMNKENNVKKFNKSEQTIFNLLSKFEPNESNDKMKKISIDSKINSGLEFTHLISRIITEENDTKSEQIVLIPSIKNLLDFYLGKNNYFVTVAMWNFSIFYKVEGNKYYLENTYKKNVKKMQKKGIIITDIITKVILNCAYRVEKKTTHKIQKKWNLYQNNTYSDNKEKLLKSTRILNIQPPINFKNKSERLLEILKNFASKVGILVKNENVKKTIESDSASIVWINKESNFITFRIPVVYNELNTGFEFMDIIIMSFYYILYQANEDNIVDYTNYWYQQMFKVLTKDDNITKINESIYKILKDEKDNNAKENASKKEDNNFLLPVLNFLNFVNEKLKKYKESNIKKKLSNNIKFISELLYEFEKKNDKEFIQSNIFTLIPKEYESHKVKNLICIVQSIFKTLHEKHKQSK